MAYQISFSLLELKGLWVKATGGDCRGDQQLSDAAEDAIQRVYRSSREMPAVEAPDASR